MENLTTKELTQLTKKKIEIFDNTYYFLGIDKNDDKLFLQEPTWDCDWFWGFGYLKTFTNNKNPELSKDTSSHTHFDSLIFENGYHLNEYLGKENSVLTDKESWTLSELVQTAYTLKKSAELFGRGGSHYTTNPIQDFLKDEQLVARINKVLLPAVFKSIRELLTKAV